MQASAKLQELRKRSRVLSNEYNKLWRTYSEIVEKDGPDAPALIDIQAKVRLLHLHLHLYCRTHAYTPMHTHAHSG